MKRPETSKRSKRDAESPHLRLHLVPVSQTAWERTTSCFVCLHAQVVGASETSECSARLNKAQNSAWPDGSTGIFSRTGTHIYAQFDVIHAVQCSTGTTGMKPGNLVTVLKQEYK